MLHQDRVQHRIGHMQQLLVARGDQQRNMPRRMSRRWNSVHTWDNLTLAINQFDLAADRWELGVCEVDKQMPEMIIHRHSGEVGMLMIP